MISKFKEGERVFISKDLQHSSNGKLGTVILYRKLDIRGIPMILYLVRFEKSEYSFWYKDSQILKCNYPYLF